MSAISRTYTFTDGTTAFGSQVDSEVQNIVTTWNNHDSAVSRWTNVDATVYKKSGFTALIPLQIIQGTKTNSQSITSATFTATTLQVNIQPQSTSSKILILVTTVLTNSAAQTGNVYATIQRDTTNLGNANGMAYVETGTATGAFTMPLSMAYLDSPGDTISHTYAVFLRAVGGVTATLNNDSGQSQIIAIELL